MSFIISITILLQNLWHVKILSAAFVNISLWQIGYNCHLIHKWHCKQGCLYLDGVLKLKIKIFPNHDSQCKLNDSFHRKYVYVGLQIYLRVIVKWKKLQKKIREIGFSLEDRIVEKPERG